MYYQTLNFYFFAIQTHLSMKNKYLPFYLFTAALFIGLIMPVLIQDGMFMDGMLYTCVSKNLGNGIGSFWFPISDATWLVDGKASFHEHPPLIFGIQSLFFRFLGNSMYVERFYIFLIACLTAFVIYLIWKEIFRSNREMLKFSWLPVLLWIITPVAHWSFNNNMQENTMGIFSILAVYFILRALNNESKTFIFIGLAGTLTFLASFSKGVPGLFPIGMVGIYWLIYRKPAFVKVVLYTIILIIIPATIYYFLMLNPDAREALLFYVQKRLLGRIETAPAVTSRFHTISGLLSHLLPVLLISTILVFVYWRKSFQVWFVNKKEFILFSLIGLNASLPLMFTMVQKDFYFSHSIPYFGIAFALLMVQGLKNLVEKIEVSKISFKIFRVATILMLIFAISFSIYCVGGKSRDKKELHDVHLLGKLIPNNTIIDIDVSLVESYNTRYYFVRYYGISSSYGTQKYKYLLLNKKSVVPDRYKKITANTELYDLYKKIPSNQEIP
jgi:4-amino-4-deoxy-L-arabinose transferase-like glycosyltransferase